MTAPKEEKEADISSDITIQEISQQGVEDEEVDEKSVLEDQEKDSFIAILAELQNEVKPKKPPLFDEDDDIVDDEMWDTEDNNGQHVETTIGQQIIVSQKEVITELHFFFNKYQTNNSNSCFSVSALSSLHQFKTQNVNN